MSRWDVIGYVASGLVLASFCMRDMIPLRLVSVCSNLAFLTYGLALGLVPVWVLHALLLPINCWRVWQGFGARPSSEH
jgi:CRP/FNR family transcriptional regulator, cyclic AMP receptor protein